MVFYSDAFFPLHAEAREFWLGGRPLERTGRGVEAGFMQRKAGLSYGLSVLVVGARIIDVQGSGSPDSSHSLLLQCLPCQPS